MLDERLELIASLVPRCALAADIGADHGLLGTALLRRGTAERVLFADISKKALSHARQTVRQNRLEDRACFAVADGLQALRAVEARCGCAVIAGMGGNTLASILRGGAEYLAPDSVLVLSAHTEHDEVRRTVEAIGYHITREELVSCAGRYYIVWRAEHGADAPWTEDELRCGKLLWQDVDETKRGYARNRLNYLQIKLDGLRRNAATMENDLAIAETERMMAFYRRVCERIEP